VGAQYKAFGSLREARTALSAGYQQYRGRSSSTGKWKRGRDKPHTPSLCVGAACSGSPGRLEYRGVNTETEQQIFRRGPFASGTNNVGEFLAIVEALKWLHSRRLTWPVYSDSENAILWVKKRKCNTKLRKTSQNRRLFESIAAAEADLLRLGGAGPGLESLPRILKWETKTWGEIPADFGRK
jgi:ribonuclease HI